MYIEYATSHIFKALQAIYYRVPLLGCCCSHHHHGAFYFAHGNRWYQDSNEGIHWALKSFFYWSWFSALMLVIIIHHSISAWWPWFFASLPMGIQYACAKQVNRICDNDQRYSCKSFFRIVHRIEPLVSYDPKNPDVNIGHMGHAKNQLWHSFEMTFFLSQFGECIPQRTLCQLPLFLCRVRLLLLLLQQYH
jgi:hypothetical protein